MKRKRPLQEGWTCPNCGQTQQRHGRGGARGCKAEAQGPQCPGLVCECPDGKCFARYLGGWRRSPCLHAHCRHCGWTGVVRSREFERAYGLSRCAKSPDGWHRTRAHAERNGEHKGMCVIIFECQMCGAKGSLLVDPSRDIEWDVPERKAPSTGLQDGTEGGEGTDSVQSTSKALPKG